MANRITAGYARMAAQISDRITSGLTTTEQTVAAGKTLDMSMIEFVKFQEVKSLAVANGTLTLDEGMTVYAALGNTPETFNAQPIHVKATLTQLFQQLLGRQIEARGAR